MAEWSIALVLKTSNGQPFVSSNLTASANKNKHLAQFCAVPNKQKQAPQLTTCRAEIGGLQRHDQSGSFSVCLTVPLNTPVPALPSKRGKVPLVLN